MDLKPLLIASLVREISFKKDRKAYQEIRALIREYKPDIVHTHASKAGAIGRLAAHKEGVPVIVHTFHGHVFHNYFGSIKTLVYKTIERYLAKKSDKLIAISPLQKMELTKTHKIAKADKFAVIPLGFDLSKFQVDHLARKTAFKEKYGVDSESINIGLIGRLTAIKNHALFLDALDYVGFKTTVKINAFIVGDGELKSEIQAKANELMHKHKHINIIFTSWIRKIELILPALDLVCLTSLNEGTPVSLIEAQAANVPVISTNVGGVKDVVSDGHTGVVIDSFEADDYGNELLKLIENKAYREGLGKQGWDFVKEKYHYKRLTTDMENLYKDLLHEKKKSI
jgi:glycosyltransferase involved in cell wall biosynthesis